MEPALGVLSDAAIREHNGGDERISLTNGPRNAGPWAAANGSVKESTWMIQAGVRLRGTIYESRMGRDVQRGHATVNFRNVSRTANEAKRSSIRMDPSISEHCGRRRQAPPSCRARVGALLQPGTGLLFPSLP